jgi:hypothetical protein
MVRKLVIPTIGAILCSLLLVDSASAASDVQIACKVVNAWPDDYVKIWPRAVAFHNKAPDKNTAASYMKNYIETYKSVFKIKDKQALNIMQGYEVYWAQLESDINHNGGKAPTSSSAPSIVVLSAVMKLCSHVKGF